MSYATYSPEDNKLRLYVGRVPRDEYEALRAEGWTSTPKQDCDFVATWTPAREDRALSYLDDGDDIQDEDYSPEERAADRAERFSGYRDKRAAEAGGHADTFDAGPSAFGHQNRARAERQAMRHDRHRVRAVSQWSKAEYWQTRTAGVIRHALHRSSASVRRGRILTLEAELRRCGENSPRWKAHYELRLGYERAMLENEGGMVAAVEMEPGGWICTGNRTGSVFTNVDSGWKQIQAVNKSPATGRVVSVKVWGQTWSRIKDHDGKPILVSVNIERLGEDAYRAPTDEERAAFQVEKKERKAKAKAEKPAAPPTINPTAADAEKLQAIWNSHADATHKRQKAYGEFKPSEVLRMTQAQYSERSKGRSYVEIIDVSEQLRERRTSAMGRETRGRVTVFKIRKAPSSGSDFYRADRVIVLTDKPQKPIPWELVASTQDEQPSAEKLRPRMAELAKVLGLSWLPESGTPESQLIDDAVYIGWAYVSSMTQFGWTDAGMAEFRAMLAANNGVIERTETGTLYSGAAVAAAR